MPTRKLSPSQDSWHSLGKWRGVCPPAPQVFVSLSLSSQAHSSRPCQTHTPSAPTAGCDHHLPPTSGPGLSRPLVASGRSVLGAPGLWTPLWRGPGLRAVASCAVHSGAVPLCAGGTVTFFLVAGDGFGSRMGGCLPNSRVQCLRQVGVLCAPAPFPVPSGFFHRVCVRWASQKERSCGLESENEGGRKGRGEGGQESHRLVARQLSRKIL